MAIGKSIRIYDLARDLKQDTKLTKKVVAKPVVTDEEPAKKTAAAKTKVEAEVEPAPAVEPEVVEAEAPESAAVPAEAPPAKVRSQSGTTVKTLTLTKKAL